MIQILAICLVYHLSHIYEKWTKLAGQTKLAGTIHFARLVYQCRLYFTIKFNPLTWSGIQ